MIDQGYVAEYAGEPAGGWYRLTAKGREVKTRDLIVIPRVPRNFNPGAPPNFGLVTSDHGLAKQLWVLWVEAAAAFAESDERFGLRQTF